MKKSIAALMLLTAVLLTGCLFSNDCELTEHYSPFRRLIVEDQNNDDILYDFQFTQEIKVYSKGCSDKNSNTTSLKVANLMECDQVVNFEILLDYGSDSLTVTETDIAFAAKETIDFGIIVYNGGRIDNAGITVTLNTSACQEK